MTQTALEVSAGNLLDSYDFNQNYRYLKTLLQELKAENKEIVRKELFGEEKPERTITKKDMRMLFRFLRKIENHYEECSNAPIPPELEQSIRSRDESEWLPWEAEAIEKVEAWREEAEEKKLSAREKLNSTLDKIRSGEKISSAL